VGYRGFGLGETPSLATLGVVRLDHRNVLETRAYRPDPTLRDRLRNHTTQTRFAPKRNVYGVNAVARTRLAHLGGGSTRAPGTMASLIDHGENSTGSEMVLIDLVRTLSEKMARNRRIDLMVTATTDRRAGLMDCEAVLSSFRSGEFEARHLDERTSLRHGVIGQETQGPGGFFMALRSIAVIRGVVEDTEAVCPGAWLLNYTNPINIVSEAVTHHSPIVKVSLC